jgi:hypothetical protein
LKRRAQLVLAAGLRCESAADMRPVVEAEHAFDDCDELARNHDGAGSDPVFMLAMPAATESGAERRLHRGDCSGQIDGALREADARDIQTVRMREFFHDGDITRRGAVLGAKGFVADAAERGATGRRAQRFPAAQPHRHFDPVGLARRADVFRLGERRLVLPGNATARVSASFGHAILLISPARMKVAPCLPQAYDASLRLP